MNHRSETQQIYSLPPLATRELHHINDSFLKKKWSWWTDLNPRPADYKSAALPTELHQQLSLKTSFFKALSRPQRMLLYQMLRGLSTLFRKLFHLPARRAFELREKYGARLLLRLLRKMPVFEALCAPFIFTRRKSTCLIQPAVQFYPTSGCKGSSCVTKMSQFSLRNDPF